MIFPDFPCYSSTKINDKGHGLYSCEGEIKELPLHYDSVDGYYSMNGKRRRSVYHDFIDLDTDNPKDVDKYLMKYGYLSKIKSLDDYLDLEEYRSALKRLKAVAEVINYKREKAHKQNGYEKRVLNACLLLLQTPVRCELMPPYSGEPESKYLYPEIDPSKVAKTWSDTPPLWQYYSIPKKQENSDFKFLPMDQTDTYESFMYHTFNKPDLRASFYDDRANVSMSFNYELFKEKITSNKTLPPEDKVNIFYAATHHIYYRGDIISDLFSFLYHANTVYAAGDIIQIGTPSDDDSHRSLDYIWENEKDVTLLDKLVDHLIKTEYEYYCTEVKINLNDLEPNIKVGDFKSVIFLSLLADNQSKKMATICTGCNRIFFTQKINDHSYHSPRCENKYRVMLSRKNKKLLS